MDQKQLLLLDNRKIYSLDRTRSKSIEAKCKKQEAIAKKSEARAALPSTSSASNDKAPAPKPSAKEQTKASESTKHSKKTRARKDVNYREESENSTSSAESHTLEKHTDDESELEGASDPGNKTPILTDHNTYPPLQTDPQQPPSGSSKVNLHSSNLATPTTNSPSCTCLPRLLLSSLPVDLGPFRHASQSPRKDLPNTQRDSPLLVQPTKTQSPLQITKEKSSRENLPSIKRDLQKSLQETQNPLSEQVRTLLLIPTIHTYSYPLGGKCPSRHNLKLETLPKSSEPLQERLAVNFPNKFSLFLTANTHVVRAGGESTA